MAQWPRTASDREGPSELQELYGSSLPASLRYGAVRRHRSPPDHAGTRDQHRSGRAPVYPKVHRSYLSIETLRYYELPWEYDWNDPDYIIILRDMEKRETDALFEHTARLRSGRLLLEPSKVQESSKVAFSDMDSNDDDHSTTSVLRFWDDVDGPASGNDWTSEGNRSLDPFLMLYERRNRDKDNGFGYGIVECHKAYDPRSRDDDSCFKKKPTVDESECGKEDSMAISEGSRFRALAVTDQELKPKLLESQEVKRTGHGAHCAPQNLSSEIGRIMLRCVTHSSYGKNWSGLQTFRDDPTGFVATPGNHNKFDALYYFQHVQQDVLNFEQFKKRVLYIPELWKLKEPLGDCLSRVQSLYEKSTQDGSFRRHMDPFFDVSHSSHYGGTRIISACIPFISLRQHSHTTETKRNLAYLMEKLFKRHPSGGSEDDLSRVNSDGSHATQTLFQSVNPKCQSRRDLKQAVCKILGPKARSYLCVTQLWLLIINEELLLTCSMLPESDLYNSLLRSPPLPQQLKTRSSHIRIETPDDRTWLLEEGKCRTYLNFTSHFSEITTNFADDFDLFLNDDLVLPHQWPIYVERAAESSQAFVIRKKSSLSISHETPDRKAVYEALGTKWFASGEKHVWTVHQKKSDLQRSAVDQNEEHKDECAHAQADSERDQGLSSPSPSEPQKESSSSVNPLPPSLLNRLSIRRPGFHFGERDGSTVRVKRIYEQEFNAIFSDNQHLSAKSMRAITLTTLSFVDISSDATIPSPYSEPPGVKSDTMGINKSSYFDGVELYLKCRPLTPKTYHRRLNDLFSECIAENNADDATLALQRSSGPQLKWKDVYEVCALLGYYPREYSHEDHPNTELTLNPFDGWLYAEILTGFRGLLRLFSPEARLHMRGNTASREWQKLLSAIVKILEAIARTLEPEPKASSVFVLRRTCECLRHLFDIVRDLELYSAMHVIASADIDKALGGVVIALLRVAQASHEIDHTISIIRASKSPRGYRKIVDDFCEITSIHNTDGHERAAHDDQPADGTQQRFDESLDQLKDIGWDEPAARSLLENGYSWKQAKIYADYAGRKLRKHFEATLTADSTINIRYKAAAFPSDILILLLPEILLRPVLDDQGPFEMYSQYVIDLDMEITTGEPSREMLERIRCLRSELKAVLLLQAEQLKLLDQVSSALFPEDRGTIADDDPHPGLPILRTLRKSIEVQNSGIMQLQDALDDLQTEARAQVSIVQDWRDNAVVVFTIITIIFLPLSFVSSVFGMNTADVRDMNHNQWIFWLTAAPFTLMVIIFTLWLVDVPPLWRWIERHGKPNGEEPVYRHSGTGRRARIFVELFERNEMSKRRGTRPSTRRTVPPSGRRPMR